MNRLLFLLKRREDYNSVAHNEIGLSTGLYNSAKFVVDMLNKMYISATLRVCIDANCIDRMVTDYKPTHCILEALWVTPVKLNELARLHPNIKWIVRLHSEMPFMANEGMAMNWLAEYIKHPNVTIGINAPRMMREVDVYLKTLGYENKTIYLPNYYTQTLLKPSPSKLEWLKVKETIDVACFGAVRPLKNHLIQAIAAVEFAERIGKKLNFHINAGRVEMKGDPVLHNLKAMFQHLYDKGHQLIMHTWCPQQEFLQICDKIDIGMQVSFSETFNIVAADLLSRGVPVVGSKEIPWLSDHLEHPDPTDSATIAKDLRHAYTYPRLNVWLNQRSLTKYTNKTKKIWRKHFEG